MTKNCADFNGSDVTLFPLFEILVPIIPFGIFQRIQLIPFRTISCSKLLSMIPNVDFNRTEFTQNFVRRQFFRDAKIHLLNHSSGHSSGNKQFPKISTRFPSGDNTLQKVNFFPLNPLLILFFKDSYNTLQEAKNLSMNLPAHFPLSLFFELIDLDFF